MALEKATGNIAMPTTSSAVSVTGLSFQPKFGIFYLSSQTSGTSANGSSHFNIAIGIYDGTTQYCIAGFAEDVVTTSDTSGGQRVGEVLALHDQTGNTTWDEEVVIAWTADGFTLTPNGTGFSSAFQCVYTVWGGTDISGVTGTFAAPAAATTDTTVSGLSFQPELVIFLGADQTSASSARANGMSLGMGFATGTASTDQALLGLSAPNSQDPVVSFKYGFEGECIGVMNSNMNDRGVLSAIASDGFTIDWTEVDGGTNQYFYLALGGTAVFDSGSFNTSASTGDLSAETTSGLTAATIDFWSVCDEDHTQDTRTRGLLCSFGNAESTTARQVVAGSFQDFVGSPGTAAEGWSSIRYDAVQVRGDFADAEVARADVSAIASGSFTPAQDDAEPGAGDVSTVYWFAVGSSTGGAVGPGNYYQHYLRSVVT